MRIEKTVESDVDTNCNWCSMYSRQKICTRRIGNKRKSGVHPKYHIIEIAQNTEKSPGDSRRLAVSQTPMRNHRLTLVWKTGKGVNNNNNDNNNRYRDLELKNPMEHESSGDIICNRCIRNNPWRIGKGLRKLRNQRTNKDHPGYSTIKIG